MARHRAMAVLQSARRRYFSLTGFGTPTFADAGFTQPLVDIMSTSTVYSRRSPFSAKRTWRARSRLALLPLRAVLRGEGTLFAAIAGNGRIDE